MFLGNILSYLHRILKHIRNAFFTLWKTYAFAHTPELSWDSLYSKLYSFRTVRIWLSDVSNFGDFLHFHKRCAKGMTSPSGKALAKSNNLHCFEKWGLKKCLQLQQIIWTRATHQNTPWLNVRRSLAVLRIYLKSSNLINLNLLVSISMIIQFITFCKISNKQVFEMDEIGTFIRCMWACASGNCNSTKPFYAIEQYSILVWVLSYKFCSRPNFFGQ